MTETVAFLFDTTHPGLENRIYGHICTLACARAVLAEVNARYEGRIFVGDVLLGRLSMRPTQVDFSPPRKLKSGTTVRSDGVTYATDRGTLAFVIWDLVDAVADQWHTVELSDFPLELSTNALFAVVWTPLPPDVAERADARLRSVDGYIGAMVVDLGNPVQREAFIGSMVEEAFIRDGEIGTRSEDDETPLAPSWAGQVGWQFTAYVIGDYDRAAPRISLPKEISARGEKTIARVARRRDSTPREKLIAAIIRRSEVIEMEPVHAAVTIPLDPPLEDAIVPEAKLRNYALSPDHPEGKHKAKLFREALGIEAKDWRYLAHQLLANLPRADVAKIRVTAHGVKYSAEIPVVGLNGVTRVVRTGWIAIDDQPAQLTTAFPASADAVPSFEPDAPVVIPEAADRFAKLYEAAHAMASQSAAEAQPNPMAVEREIIWEGMAGSATVRFASLQTPFVRWLRENGIGHKHHRRGWMVFAESGNSQSVDRAIAYAKTFARVLRANGIDCDVESRLD